MKTLREFAGWLDEQETNQAESSFSIEQLKLLTKLADINSYLLQTLGRPSAQGQFRKVYNLDETSVIKVVKKIDAIEQNKQEMIHAQCLGTEFAIQVIDHDPRFYWIAEEKASVLSEQAFIAKFSETTGLKIEERMKIGEHDEKASWVIPTIIAGCVSGKKMTRYSSLYPRFMESPWFASLVTRLKGCEVSSDDFHHKNWGIRPSTGELVLLDLGF